MPVQDFHSSDAEDQSLWDITVCYGVIVHDLSEVHFGFWTA